VTSPKGWVSTKIWPRTWRYRFYGRHVRRPWLVLRQDGSVWGRYEKKLDARIWVSQFSREGFRLGYKAKRKSSEPRVTQ
jgi:hypothetical protein